MNLNYLNLISVRKGKSLFYDIILILLGCVTRETGYQCTYFKIMGIFRHFPKLFTMIVFEISAQISSEIVQSDSPFGHYLQAMYTKVKMLEKGVKR